MNQPGAHTPCFAAAQADGLGCGWKLHGSVAAPRPGYSAEPLPFRPSQDIWVMGMLLGALVLLALLASAIRQFLALRLRIFAGLGTSSDLNSVYAARNTLEKHYGFFATLLLALAHALVLYGMCQPLMAGTTQHTPTPLVIGYYYAGALSILVLRYLLYQFVNCIFFDKMKRRIWNDNYFLLLFAEAGLFLSMLTVLAATGSLNVPAVALLFLLGRLILCLKSYGVLFGKWYCLLHFFVYFCALEIVPAAVILTLLVRHLSSLVEKF